jgi:hypothetical protein
MRHGEDAMLLVRAELCDRLEALTRMTCQLTARDFAARLEAIRTLAAAYGLTPAVRLTEALERAVAERGRAGLAACPIALYLTRLKDAIGCEKVDERTSEALLASVSVRFGG